LLDTPTLRHLAHRRRCDAVRPRPGTHQTLLLPGHTHPITMAKHPLRNTTNPTGLVESPVLSNGHAGFGRRPGETDQRQRWHRAPGRPHPRVCPHTVGFWTRRWSRSLAAFLRCELVH